MHIFSPAQLFGYVAFVLGVASFLQKSDKRLIIFNASECVVYTVHFFLLGNLTASGSALVSAIRSLISLRWRAPIMAAIFILFNLTVGYCAARHWTGWFPVVGSCVATFGLFFMRGVGLRLMFLTSTAFWIANNILSGSIGGTALEFTIFATNSTNITRMLLRERRVKRQRADSLAERQARTGIIAREAIASE
ncbi:MAG: YgjV family protein [Rhizomicrobium sp.]